MAERGKVQRGPLTEVDTLRMTGTLLLRMLDDRCAMLIVENDVDHIHLKIFPTNKRSGLTIMDYERFDPREAKELP